MNMSNEEVGFNPTLNPAVVASALARRVADRHFWDGIRGVRRNANRILYERECPQARAFVNEALAPTHHLNPVERLRNARLRALGKALRASNPSLRLMELATYHHLRRETAKVMR